MSSGFVRWPPPASTDSVNFCSGPAFSLHGSRQTLPTPQAPLGDEAEQRKEEHRRLMPEGGRPGLRDRHVPMRQAGGEFVQFVRRDDFAASPFRNGFEQGAMRFQGAEFFGGGIGGPADVVPAH